MVYGCRGNHRGEPYTSTVSSWDDESKKTWIAAMPNDPASLATKKKIWTIFSARGEVTWTKV